VQPPLTYKQQYQTKFYAKETPYLQAERIRKEVGDATEPIAAGWADKRLGEIWSPRDNGDGLSASRIAGIALGAAVFLSIGGLLLRHRVIAPKPKPLAERPVATMIQSSTKGSD